MGSWNGRQTTGSTLILRWLGAGFTSLALVVSGCAIEAPPERRSAAAGPSPRAAALGDSPAAGAELLIGQSAPLSGPSAQLGQEYREGAMAWFDEVNRRGGIHGRRLRLISRDDRYEPALTERNTHQLIEQDRVFVLFGYVGTPTVKAVLPMVEHLRIPLVAPLTGAAVVRDPRWSGVFHLRSGYQAEIDRIVDTLVRAGRHRLAVLHQADAFGDDGLRSARRALQRHGLKPVATAAVARNSSATGAAAASLLQAQPTAVLMVTSYPGAAAFRRDLRAANANVQLMSVSFVGTRALQDALPGGEGNGIGITQVVPFPWDRQQPVVAEYQQLMARRRHRPQYGFNSLEGFLAARMLTEGLQRTGPRPSRQQLVRSLESIRDLDLGGFRLQLGPGDHNASDYVDLTYLGAQTWGP